VSTQSGPHSTRARRSAIVFADLVESVRLYQVHEAITIERWLLFVEQARALVPRHGGRLVRTAGDGLLLDFGAVAGATAAAFELHELMPALNTGVPDAAAMWLRIGIHVAEVVADTHELYGAGVNLAARLAALALPGQTLASAHARHELVDGLDFRVEDQGLHYVKHLEEPLRAFLLRPAAGDVLPAAAMNPPQADLRPAVAVVPFVASPADAEHDALGHAMADDIIASLARQPGLRVLSRVTTAAVRDVTHDLPRLRGLLGASFLLSGRFLVRGQRIRLAAELCELQRGEVLWAGTAHADVDALFEGQDDLVPHLVAQVTQQVLAHELARVRSLPMSSLESYSLFLGAAGLMHSLVKSDFARAREVLQHLAERHPRQAAPQALLSGWHVFRMLQGWADDADRDQRLIEQHARRALDLDPSLPEAHVAQGVARVFGERDFEGASRCYLKALELNPQHAVAWSRLSETQRHTGELQTAQQSAQRALALSPLDPLRFMFESFAASAAFGAGEYARAALHARSSLRRHMLHAPAHRILIASLWFDGQADPARQAAQDYLRCMPGARVSTGVARATGRGAAQAPVAQALLAAGVPP
jgi:adenylate cyclase